MASENIFIYDMKMERAIGIWQSSVARIFEGVQRVMTEEMISFKKKSTKIRYRGTFFILVLFYYITFKLFMCSIMFSLLLLYNACVVRYYVEILQDGAKGF